MLVSFRGPMGVGKTTAALHLVDTLGFVRVAWADPLRIEVYDALDLGYFRFPEGTPLEVKQAYSSELSAFPKNPNDDEKIAFIQKHKKVLRPLLQWWGTEYRRGEDPEYWVTRFKETVKPLMLAGVNVVVDDTRFENELLAVKALGGCDILIEADEQRIKANLKSRDGKVAKGLAEHASEEGLPYESDATIVNNGDIDQLRTNTVFVIGKHLTNPMPARRRRPRKKLVS